MTAISATSGAINTALTIVKGMIGLRDQNKFGEKTAELLTQIVSAYQAAMEAQQAQTALMKRNDELEAEIVRLKDWEGGRQNYELKNVWQGAMAYMHKAGMRNQEPPHWLCTKCFEDRKKSILLPTATLDHVGTKWICPACKASMFVDERVAPQFLD